MSGFAADVTPVPSFDDIAGDIFDVVRIALDEAVLGGMLGQPLVGWRSGEALQDTIIRLEVDS